MALSNMTSNFIKTSQEQLVVFLRWALVPSRSRRFSCRVLLPSGLKMWETKKNNKKGGVGGREPASLANWNPHLTEAVPSDVISIQMLCCGRMKESNRHEFQTRGIEFMTDGWMRRQIQDRNQGISVPIYNL